MKKQPSSGAHSRARTLRRNMTEAERQVWRILRLRQMEGHKFRRQVPIGRFIADFACHEARLIIEIDGGQHDLSLAPETERTEFLEGEGYRVLRFWNNEVLANLDGVHRAITEALDRGTPTQTLPHRGGGVSSAEPR
jgi:very-short-patch-repair endonuclease